MKPNLKTVLLCLLGPLLGARGICNAATADSAGSTGTLPAEIAAPNTPVVAVYKVNSFCEGPAWDGKGRLVFSSSNAGKIYSYEPATKTQAEFITLQGANGQEWANDGRLYSCGRGGIFSYNAQGGDKQTFLTATPDPNDLTIDSKGNVYFSTYNPTFSFKPANGTAKTVNPKAYKSSNGIEFLEESGILYVNDYAGGFVYKYNATSEGVLSNETTFATVSSPDGITVDELGNVYVSSGLAGTIVVYNSAGLKQGEITVSSAPGGDSHPGIGYNTSNCVFGGPDRKTLYITGDGGLYAVQLKVAGRLRPGGASAIFHRSPRALGGKGSQAGWNAGFGPQADAYSAVTFGFLDSHARPQRALPSGRLLPAR
jgi:gluconolactonase